MNKHNFCSKSFENSDGKELKKMLSNKVSLDMIGSKFSNIRNFDLRKNNDKFKLEAIAKYCKCSVESVKKLEEYFAGNYRSPYERLNNSNRRFKFSRHKQERFGPKSYEYFQQVRREMLIRHALVLKNHRDKAFDVRKKSKENIISRKSQSGNSILSNCPTPKISKKGKVSEESITNANFEASFPKSNFLECFQIQDLKKSRVTECFKESFLKKGFKGDFPLEGIEDTLLRENSKEYCSKPDLFKTQDLKDSFTKRCLKKCSDFRLKDIVEVASNTSNEIVLKKPTKVDLKESSKCVLKEHTKSTSKETTKNALKEATNGNFRSTYKTLLTESVGRKNSFAKEKADGILFTKELNETISKNYSRQLTPKKIEKSSFSRISNKTLLKPKDTVLSKNISANTIENISSIEISEFDCNKDKIEKDSVDNLENIKDNKRKKNRNTGKNKGKIKPKGTLLEKKGYLQGNKGIPRRKSHDQNIKSMFKNKIHEKLHMSLYGYKMRGRSIFSKLSFLPYNIYKVSSVSTKNLILAVKNIFKESAIFFC